MVRHLSRWLFPGAFLLSLWLPLASASDEELPKAEDLIKKFAQRWREEEKQKLEENYGFIEHRIFEQFDKGGNVKEHQDRRFQLVMLEDKPFLRWIEKDGKPLSGEDLKKQQEREKRALEERRKHLAARKKAPDEDLKLDDEFLARFRYEVIAKEDIRGRPAFVVTVLPRSKDLPARNNSEKLFNRMQGKVWVDAQDYSLAKADMHLSEPASFYGFLGAVRQLDLLMQRTLVDNKVWMPEKVNFALEARRLVSSMRMKQESEYSDFRKLTN